MRRVAILLALLGAILGIGVLEVDLAAPPAGLIPGSAVFPPEVTGLQVLASDPDCDPDGFDPPCATRLAYAAGGSIIAWVPVRNSGPGTITLHGVNQRWLDQFDVVDMLVAPVGGFDGGDTWTVAANGPRHDTFEAVQLAPRDERVVGVRFQVTADTDFACALGGRRCPELPRLQRGMDLAAVTP